MQFMFSVQLVFVASRADLIERSQVSCRQCSMMGSACKTRGGNAHMVVS